jgi:flagellar hook protein FlgE
MMDVIGNNIANINTVAFKGGRISFSELFAQTLANGTQPTGSYGGTNPMQIGLGMKSNTIDTLFGQGSVENTGNGTDLAIQGNGFFAVQKGNQTLYTRVGTFAFDASGQLVQPGTGAILLGKVAQNGVIPTGTSLDPIKIAQDLKAAAKATDSIKFAGNLNSEALAGGTTSTSMSIFDSLGNGHSLTLTFTKSANPNEWTWSVSVPSPATITAGGSGTITFDANGAFSTRTFDDGSGNLVIDPANGASPITITDANLDMGKTGVFAGITQSKGDSLVSAREISGYASGSMTGITIDLNGTIKGNFSNGVMMTMGQIMLVDFTNPAGLVRTGDMMYDISGNSGTPSIVQPGVSSTTRIVAGALEQSNVDLADEFTKMITAQRGFQANGRVITTADEILTEVVNLKR